MDQRINIFGLGELRQVPSRNVPAPHERSVETARQVPGSHAGASRLVKRDARPIGSNDFFSKVASQLVTKSFPLLPELLKNLELSVFYRISNHRTFAELDNASVLLFGFLTLR
jgi:hypothetical protein